MQIERRLCHWLLCLFRFIDTWRSHSWALYYLVNKQDRPDWGEDECSLPPQSNLCPPVMAVTNAAPASPCWSAGGVSVNQQTLCIILCVRCWCRCEHPSLTCLYSSPRDTSQLLVNTLIVTVKDVLENRRRTNTQHPEHRGNRSLQ